MYEHEARQRGIDVDTFTHPWRDVDRAITDGEEDGFVKIHVKKGTDQMLGATGEEATRLVDEVERVTRWT